MLPNMLLELTALRLGQPGRSRPILGGSACGATRLLPGRQLSSRSLDGARGNKT